jgi:hypothetical protein
MKDKNEKTPYCYHCGASMEKLSSPSSNLKSELNWDGDFLWICVNGACPVFVNGFSASNALSDEIHLFRSVVDPENGSCALARVSPFTSADIGALLDNTALWGISPRDALPGLSLVEEDWTLFTSHTH